MNKIPEWFTDYVYSEVSNNLDQKLDKSGGAHLTPEAEVYNKSSHLAVALGY